MRDAAFQECVRCTYKDGTVSLPQNCPMSMGSGESCLLICENWTEEIRKKIVVAIVTTNKGRKKKSLNKNDFIRGKKKDTRFILWPMMHQK